MQFAIQFLPKAVCTPISKKCLSKPLNKVK